jgi:hypothetical protein
MKTENIHKYEKAVVWFFNFDGWELEWTGENYEHFDAKGKTPKGLDCVMEMKFRNKHYDDKLLERYKYEKLMALDKDIVKLYFVADPKGNYMFWLNNIDVEQYTNSVYAPRTTMWNNSKTNKDVFLLPESESSLTTFNEPEVEKAGIWTEYFKKKDEKNTNRFA